MNPEIVLEFATSDQSFHKLSVWFIALALGKLLEAKGVKVTTMTIKVLKVIELKYQTESGIWRFKVVLNDGRYTASSVQVEAEGAGEQYAA